MHSADLLVKLNAVDESMRIEAKRASELGKSVVGAEAEACNRELATLLLELATLFATLKDWARADALRHVIVRLCAWVPLTVEQLATLLGKARACLRNKHLPPIVRADNCASAAQKAPSTYTKPMWPWWIQKKSHD